MRDLSLHILDLAQNSVRAGASLVESHVLAWTTNRLITLAHPGRRMRHER